MLRILMLVLALLAFVSAPLFAAESPATTEVRVRTLSESDALGDKLIEEIRAANPEGGASVRILHIEGTRPDERLIPLIQKLTRSGIAVESAIVSREAFDEAARTPGAALEQTHLRFERDSSPMTIRDRLRLFAGKLFGTPHGVTVIEHFVARDAEGKLRLRFDSESKAYLKLGALSAAIANGFFSMSLLSGGMSATDAKFLTANAVLATWVFGFIRFQREVSSFKMQGVTVDGQLKPTPNKLFFTATSIVQEIICSGLIVTALGGRFFDGLENGFLSAFSYIPVEYWRSSIARAAENARTAAARLKAAGDVVGAAEQEKIAGRFERKARRISFLWWNVAFPVMRSMHFLFTTGIGQVDPWVMRAPFLVVGAAGFAFDLWKSRAQIASVFGRRRDRTSCENLLLVQAPTGR